MGIKSGRFTGRNGHEYEVALVGATVATSTIELGIPPATISMAAGEHKFCGFKSTTATVNILTDVPLIELYSAGVTDIRLTIEDMTDDKVEFDGYVTPFSFDQPYTGKNDSVTVNAVDLLTARKEVKYENIVTDNEREYGTDRYAIDIIASLAHSAGIETIVEHINFDVTSTSPLHVRVAQAGFLQDEVGELDALSAICKFFGMTACCVGRTLYLYDEHCLLNADQGHSVNANVYDISDGRAVRTAQYYDSQDTPLNDQVIMSTDAVHNDISVTIERAYDGVQITPEGSDTSVLLPDVCADENLDTNDDILGTGARLYQDYDHDNDIDYIQWREPRKSLLMVTGESSDDGPVAWTGGDKMLPDNADANYWQNGSIPIRITHAKRTRATVFGEDIIAIDSATPTNMLWLRGYGGSGYVARQRDDKRYSHTGGIVEVSMTYRLTYRSDWQDIEKVVDIDGIGYVGMLQVKVGDSYFLEDVKSGVAPAWGTSPNGHFLTKDGKLLPTNQGEVRYAGRALIVVPNNGQIAVELRWNNGQFAGIASPDMYIESLSINAVGEPMNLEDIDLRHEYVADPREMLDVRTMLTTRRSTFATNQSMPSYGGINARPAVVTDTSWKGGYMGRADSESIPISGILMEQLKARYAQPRICYKMTVEKNINPYAAVYFGGKGYTVEAYDKDLYNSTTTITID